MADRQEQNGTDEKGLFGDFSVSTVIASGLAAATSFALSSKIGLAGSIIGVAIGGVASAAASQIYKSLLKASAQKLSDLTPDATTRHRRPRVPRPRTQRPTPSPRRTRRASIARAPSPAAPPSRR